MSYQLFDKIRAFFKPTHIYGHENIIQNQADIERVSKDGNIINYNTKGLIDGTNLQVNRMERYKDYDMMSEMGEISLSLDLYADEGTQLDTERKQALLIRAKDKKVKDELEHLFFNVLAINNKLRPMMRYLCKYGDFAAEIVPSVYRNAVASIRPINIYNFLRVETRYGDLVGFFYNDPQANNSEPVFMHPWQVAHMRLMSYENIFAPYGVSILEGARRDFRRLRLMEDAALIYRITRAPVKRVFTIPVGNIPAHEVPDFLRQIADSFKKHRFYDPASGEVNWKYAPLIQEDDFWMPVRPDGNGPKVDTLPGAENLDQIADIEYFKKKMVAALKIPFERVGIGQNAGVGSDKSLSSTSNEFAKAVQWIQMELANGLKKIALVHLALAGFSIESMNNFQLSLTASSAIDELYRIETWNSRATVISSLKETQLFPDEWILKHFTDMTDDEIKEMKEEQETKAEEQGEEGQEAAPDLGMLPGLGESSELNSSLSKRVIKEYKTLRSKRQKKIQNVVKEQVFDIFLNNGELAGLPTPRNTEQSGVISESIEEQTDDYLVTPPEADINADEAQSAIKENRALLIELNESLDKQGDDKQSIEDALRRVINSNIGIQS